MFEGPSFGGLILGLWLDAINEVDAINDVGEMDESAQLSPTLSGTFPQLEYHMKHAVMRQAAFRRFGTVADHREGAFDGV